MTSRHANDEEGRVVKRASTWEHFPWKSQDVQGDDVAQKTGLMRGRIMVLNPVLTFFCQKCKRYSL